MSNQEQPLIAGAGPVGLAAALFLARAGISARVVEMRGEPSNQSKALAVNPRTLQILDHVGLTDRLLAIGTKTRGASLWRGARLAATIDFDRLRGKYPFMLGLSQAATERILAQALVESGGAIDRNTRLADCKNEAGRVVASLETPRGPAAVQAPWMLAADGARSTARERLGIPFPGSTFQDKWELADVALDVPLAEDRAHALFLPHGEFQFMIRVIDPVAEAAVDGPLWRVIGNRANLLDRLATGRILQPPIWTSSFSISHRIVPTMSVGNIHFAGDAAHIHSPVGARGMNLGIEDAWVFAQLARNDQLSHYASRRYPIDRGVVRHVALFSRVVACEPAIFKLLRPVVPWLVRAGLPTARMMAIVTGTGHPLDHFTPVARPN